MHRKLGSNADDVRSPEFLRGECRCLDAWPVGSEFSSPTISVSPPGFLTITGSGLAAPTERLCSASSDPCVRAFTRSAHSRPEAASSSRASRYSSDGRHPGPPFACYGCSSASPSRTPERSAETMTGEPADNERGDQVLDAARIRADRWSSWPKLEAPHPQCETPTSLVTRRSFLRSVWSRPPVVFGQSACAG